MTSKNVLFSILNWGLGHASRSLPIIQQVLQRGHQVTIASDGRAAYLLKQELPNLDHLTLPSYGVTYSGKNFLAQHIRLAVRTAKAIDAEKRAIKTIMNDQQFDVIISDNRFGTYHQMANNVIITHQLNIPLAAPLRKMVSTQIRRYVQKFDVCWIPDGSGAQSLSGQLSEGILNIPKRYIGTQSRFESLNEQQIYELALILSGPEPQRSFLQKEIFQQLQKMQMRSVVVLGVSDTTRKYASLGPQVEVHQMLTSNELNRKICQSKKVLSRSGYSTLMDLIKLSKPAILIPTPGQPEQNYLSELHKQNPLFHFQKQTEVDITSGIDSLDQLAMSPQKANANAIESEALLKAALLEIGL